MKLPSDETPPNNMNGEGYISDEFDQLEIMPAPIRDGDFSEYLWMENEEEFDSEVMRELEEEELMKQCIVAMLDDEYQQANNNSRNNENDNNVNSRNNTENNVTPRNNSNDISNSVNGLSDYVNDLSLSSNGVRNNNCASNNFDSNNRGTTTNNTRPRFTMAERLNIVRRQAEERANAQMEQKSNLNPDAKEFVPLTRNSAESTSKNENVSSS